MQILAHRGFWTDREDMNSLAAFQRAFSDGFGVETDVRDLDGELVISHDPARRGAMPLHDFLAVHGRFKPQLALALNIKADGLADAILAMVGAFKLENYFVFDMSVPDTLHYVSRGLTVFTRRSEFETGSSLDSRAAGLWLDCFEDGFVTAGLISSLLPNGRKLAVVSPELHRRPHQSAWESWRGVLGSHRDGADEQFMLCTDFPAQARDFFAS